MSVLIGGLTMEVLEVISTKMDLAQHFLSDLLKNYRTMDDTARIEKADIALDNINSYLQIEQNLLFPFIAQTGEHDDIIERAHRVHDRIDEILERAVMVHVDEPDHQFYNSMAALMPLLENAQRHDHEAVFPWVKAYLSEADHFNVISHLKEQTAHEAVSSLAWQNAMFRSTAKKKGTDTSYT